MLVGSRCRLVTLKKYKYIPFFVSAHQVGNNLINFTVQLCIILFTKIVVMYLSK
jgi:hypothetical protein